MYFSFLPSKIKNALNEENALFSLKKEENEQYSFPNILSWINILLETYLKSSDFSFSSM